MQFSGNTSTLNVEISDKSGIAVPTAVNYIKSGEKEIENAVNEGITQFNTNATAKTTAYDNNAAAKLNAYNENDTVKTAAYNQNATEKTTAFNANATSKTADFNTNASDKTTAFDNNASAKTTAFNDNATSKTTAFNTNASEKQAAVDAAATAAAASASTSKQWAVGEPTEPTGNSSKYWAQSAAASASNMANRDLSNLSSDGQMIVDSVNGTISNCVLEIPQNLKLEFSNGTVTLKAGSTIVRSGSTYQTLTTTQDTSWTTTTMSNTKAMLFVSNSGYTQTLYGWWNLNKVGSGSSLPADNTNYTIFFNTTNKEFYQWEDNNWVIKNYAYPIAVVEIDSQRVITGFAKDSNGNDMIFNGAGFIGHHAFVYPNVSVLYPWGFTDDKHLNSVSVTTNQLYIIELATNRNTLNITGFSSQVSLTTRGADLNHRSEVTDNNIYHYITLENYICSGTSSGVVNRQLTPFVNYTYNGTTVTDFTIRQPIRLATTEMLNNGLAQKQDTLVSGTNIKTINSTSVLGSGNFTLADQSLSNLDSNGQMVVDSQNGTISNCILDIPQNLKLTLENNVLTLKSGSVLTDSGATYQTITITSDKTTTISTSSNNRWLIFATRSGVLAPVVASVCVSGATDSLAGQPIHIWFDTTNQEVLYYGSDGTTGSHRTYPLCVIDVIDGVASFAKDSNGNDMIFNGAGFIGHHAFVYPNVKALIPNGLNEDGSLKSISTINNVLTIIEMSGTAPTGYVRAIQKQSNIYIGNFSYREVDDLSELDNSDYYSYVKSKNQIYTGKGVAVERIVLSFYTVSGTTVTDFTIRQPVRMATVEMLKDKQNKLTFDTAPTSNSTNPVTSGGVYTALAAKADDNAVVHLAENETITGNKTFSGTNTFVTPAVSDNSQKPATTAYVNNKFQVVSALPASPDADTFYFIPES